MPEPAPGQLPPTMNERRHGDTCPPADEPPAAVAQPGTPAPEPWAEGMERAETRPADPAAAGPNPYTMPGSAGGVAPPGGTDRIALPGYEILGELGRGGMGVVYKARHVKLNRLVALKMILAGGHASASELARFRTEAEAVARLQHPNIVQIYEIGEHHGLPYLSLEFVDGGSLDRQLDGTPLSPASAAQLAETLARTVHVAHERGIIHRDLKPANILLSSAELGARSAEQANDLPAFRAPRSEFRAPKIADFGLAKRLDASTGQTKSGAIMGTPSYMAPEQARGESKEVGPAADIYALGAILYETLTGRPPFKAAASWDTVVQVLSEDPVPPSRLQPKVPRDLETICLKCLQKEVSRRYPSAAALADDLRRFQNGEPIQARPAGSLERLWRTVQRRPVEAALAAVGGVMVVVLAVLIVRERISAQERRHSQELQEKNDKIEEQARRADDNFAQALAAVNDIFQLVSEGELRNRPDLQPLRKKLLDYYLQYARQRENDPRLQAELAGVYERLAKITQDTDKRSDAVDYYKKAEALYRKLADGRPDYRARLGQLSINWGILTQALGDLPAARFRLEDARDDLEALAAAYPDNLEYRRLLAEAHHNLGILYDALSQRPQSLAAYDKGRVIREELVRKSPERLYRRDLARSYGYLGDVQLELGQKDEAKNSYEKSQEIRQKLVNEDRSDTEARFQLARSIANFGNFYSRTDDIDRAINAYENARVYQEDLVRERPTVTEYRSDLGGTYNSIAELHLDGHRPTEAGRALDKARKISEGLVEANPDDTQFLSLLAQTAINLGRFYQMTNPSEARKYLDDARERLTRLGGKRSGDLGDLYGLAQVHALYGLLAGQGKEPLSAAEQAQRSRHADQALDYLRQAVAHGYERAARLKRDTSFEALRSRRDFTALVAEVEGKVKGDVK